MVQNVSLVPMTSANPYYRNVVTRRELRGDEKVFDNAEKLVKKDKVRNSDYGLVAAQTCLARDFVNADVEEARLLAAKMAFVHNIMKDNLDSDTSRYCDEARAKVELMPAKAELSRSRSEGVSSVIKSGADAINTVKRPLNCMV